MLRNTKPLSEQNLNGPKRRRRRKCEACGKPLGNTLGRCHECGGESYRCGYDYDPEAPAGERLTYNP